jgi:hypothetical protein
MAVTAFVECTAGGYDASPVAIAYAYEWLQQGGTRGAVTAAAGHDDLVQVQARVDGGC